MVGPAAATPPAEPEPRFEKLDNGLRICAIAAHSQPLVRVQLWFRIGANLDPPTLPGLCHATLQTLAQRGRASEVPLGHVIEVNTFADAAQVSFTASAQSLNGALTLCRTWLSAAPLTETEWNSATAAFASQTAECVSPVLPLLFANRPYLRPPDSISAATCTAWRQANDLCSTWLVPSQATLFISGDFEPAVVFAAFRASLAGLNWRATPSLPDAEPAPGASGRATATDSRTHLLWRGRALHSAESTARQVVLELLARRICSVTDEVELLATPIGRGVSVLEIDWGGQPDAERVLSELRAIEREGCTVEELLRARSQALRRYANGRFGWADWADRLAEAEMLSGDILLAFARPVWIAHVSVSEIRAAAKHLADEEPIVLTPVIAARPTASAPTRESGAGKESTRLGQAIGEPRAPPIWWARPTFAQSQPPRVNPLYSLCTPAPVELHLIRRTGKSTGGLCWTLTPLPPSGRLQFAVRFPRVTSSRPVGAPVPLAASEWRNLCELRGIELIQDQLPGEIEIRATGPAQEQAALLELLARAARDSKAPADALALSAAGDLDAENMEALATDFLAEFHATP